MRSWKTSPGRGRSARRTSGLVASAAACLSQLAAFPSAAQSDRCLASECFSDQQIRDFQVVDEDTLVIYAGRDRCAFMVNVDGLYCSLTYLPEVEFFRTTERNLEVLRGQRSGRDSAIVDPTTGRFARNDRVCTHNATLYALESFGFAAIDPVTVPSGRASCQVREITSITDNDLVEILANEDIAAPPPPVGNGEISRRQPQSGQSDEE